MASSSLRLIHSSSNPATNPSSTALTSYLKSYPYLFVRESDQTDYFCTICDSYLKEEQLQTHLFDGHRAENLRDYFVKISVERAGQPATFKPAKPNSNSSSSLFICVVCWAKILTMGDMNSHRHSCKIESSSSPLTQGIVQVIITDSIIT